jgi:hypothetical protein
MASELACRTSASANGAVGAGQPPSADGHGMILLEKCVDTKYTTYRVISAGPGPEKDSGPCEVSVMTSRDAERTPDRSAKAVIAMTLLALLLVAAVPVALLAGVIMMILGHIAGGLALSGGSVLAAAIAVALAGMSGLRHLRKLVSGPGFRVVRLTGGQYTDAAEPEGSHYADVVRLDRSEYTEVR